MEVSIETFFKIIWVVLIEVSQIFSIKQLLPLPEGQLSSNNRINMQKKVTGKNIMQ
jgi:hypothetical protein